MAISMNKNGVGFLPRVPGLNAGDLVQMAKAVRDHVAEDDLISMAKAVRDQVSVEVKAEFDALQQRCSMLEKRLENRHGDQIELLQKSLGASVGGFIEALKSLPSPQVMVPVSVNLEEVKSLVDRRMDDLVERMKVLEAQVIESASKYLDGAWEAKVHELAKGYEGQLVQIRESYLNGVVQIKELLKALPAPKATFAPTFSPNINVPKSLPTPINIMPSEVSPVFQMEVPKKTITKKDIVYDETNNRPKSIVETTVNEKEE